VHSDHIILGTATGGIVMAIVLVAIVLGLIAWSRLRKRGG
jgi:hypothetical protein